MSSSESLRQMIHMSVVVFAFLLRFLSAPWALLLAFGLLIHNILLLPRYAPHLFRPGERRWGGILFYPLALCVLILVFPQRLEVVAGVWALLAIGDGLATLVGQLRPLAPLPWNPEKSLAGLIAFVVGGTLACTVLVVWTVPAVGESGWILLTCGVCALIAALSESLLLPVNDNLLVPVAAAPALSLLLAAEVSGSACTFPAHVLLLALCVNVLLAVGAYQFQLVSRNGACGAAVIGTLVWILGGWPAYVLLLLFFVAESGIVWSKFIGENVRESWSRRGSKHALTLCGFPLFLAFLWAITSGVDPVLKLMYVAALAAALADRVAAELGRVLGRSSFSPLTLENVPSGAAGALSPEGSLLGICAALIFSLCASSLGLCRTSLLPAVIVGATISLWIKSVTVATATDRDAAPDGEWLNFINTFTGALCTVIAAYLLAGGGLYS